jgi:hypothetical protein
MDLNDYFANTEGTGILATSDKKGNVNLALYAVPYIVDENTVGFVMRDRLSHKNLQSNPKAAYMFIEQGEGYVGKRLYLTKIRDEKNTPLIKSLKRQNPAISPASLDDTDKYLVYFKVDKIRPLMGDRE